MTSLPASPTPDPPDEGAAPGTEGAPDLARLSELFSLSRVEPASLTPFAAVHRCRTAAGEEAVLKRTASAAAAMARWLRALDAAGVDVVVPLAEAQVLGEETWVLYPYIDGESYSGTTEQLRAAGDLLGRLHAAEVPLEGLRRYAHPSTVRAEVEADLVTLREILHRALPAERAAAADASITALGARWFERSWPALRAADPDLPRTGVSSDWKAANLVFRPGGAVLVDPDNGGVEPRLLDLALALVLLPCETPGAPPRMLEPAEWDVLVGAYARHVTLTERERELWPAALDHQWWEEGTWVLEDAGEDGWTDPVQGGYLRSLAQWDPAPYRLPA